MRIWDLNPGYLNGQSLLGEHRELHAIVSIIVNKKKGYAKHPETIRWIGYGWALKMRHRKLACEMALRGYTDRSPVATHSNKGKWPETHIDCPDRQLILLKEKYVDKEEGRIPLPKNLQEFWSQHKYSVLARNPDLYKKIGRDLSNTAMSFGQLSILLIKVLREQPDAGGIRNAVQHMWGYVSDNPAKGTIDINDWPLRRLLSETQKRAMAGGSSYIRASTALSELMAWLPDA
ncbi:MAG: DUF1722 domain-containing protein [Candidatus Krumholzibacteriota bacterium]|nr:DUF1722 domain-containing protein [Candidatus Krumholzibacteriota bacterium]